MIGAHKNRKDLSGKRFGRLTAIEPGLGITMNGSGRIETSWKCICECGGGKEVLSASLNSGGTRSCGCWSKESSVQKRFMDLVGRRFGRLVVVSRGRIHESSSETAIRSKRRRNYWLCKCDCGKTKEASKDTLMQGLTKSCGCLRIERTRNMCGEQHPQWKGGRRYNEDGYVIINVGHGKSKGEHIVVMEKNIGRMLFPEETVHHKNGVKDDNRIDNLELWASNHPSGQRITDQVKWAKELLKRYEPDALEKEREPETLS